MIYLAHKEVIPPGLKRQDPHEKVEEEVPAKSCSTHVVYKGDERVLGDQDLANCPLLANHYCRLVSISKSSVNLHRCDIPGVVRCAYRGKVVLSIAAHQGHSLGTGHYEVLVDADLQELVLFHVKLDLKQLLVEVNDLFVGD